MNQTMRYRAANNQELVEYLKRKGVIKSQRIYDVMSKVDRKKYVNNHNPYNEAYIDSPQNIGNGRTISAPHMHGIVLETLDSKLTNGSKVLVIRCSAGYLATCMASLVGPSGTVVHVESNPDVQHKVKANIINDDPSLLINNRIELILGDELNGYSSEAPYDVIYIGAAVSEIPQKIIDQLAIDGLLLLPVIESKHDVNSQMLTLVKRNIFSDKGFTKRALIPVRYGILNSSPIIKQVINKKGNSCSMSVQNTPKTSTLQIPKILETPVPITSFGDRSIFKTKISDDKSLQNTTKVTNIENGMLPVPKILETPVSVSSFGCKSIFETKISDDKSLQNPTEVKNIENGMLPVPKILETSDSIFSFGGKSIFETKISDDKSLQNPTEVKNIENGMLPEPKILETPVSIFSFGGKSIFETKISNDELLPVPTILEKSVSVPSVGCKNISETRISDNTRLSETPKAINIECSTLPEMKTLEKVVSMPSFDFNNVFEKKISDITRLPETPKAINIEDCTLPVPKILGAPISTSHFSDKNISELNVNNEKLNDNCHTNEIELVTGQDTDIAKLKDNVDGLEKKLSELENSFKTTLKTSSILKLYAIQEKYCNLNSEINIAKNSLEQKMTEQYDLIVKTMSKQLESNLLKLNGRLTNKSAVMEKNSTILEKKLNKKIAKLKRILEDKINDEGRFLVKELSVFKVSIEEKLAIENATFYQKIGNELERRDSLLLAKIKEEFLCLREAEKIKKNTDGKGEKTVRNNPNTHLGFYVIITFHTLVAVSKIFS